MLELLSTQEVGNLLVCPLIASNTARGGMKAIFIFGTKINLEVDHSGWYAYTMGRGNRTTLTATSTPRFEEMITKRVTMIEHEAVFTEQIVQIKQELEILAPSLIETLEDAKAHGTPLPTFLHDGEEFTVHAAKIYYSGIRNNNIVQTVLAIEREVPAVRLNASSSANYQRQLLLLQPLKPPRKRLSAWSSWDENLSMAEARNLRPASDALVIAFAESSADILDQVLMKAEQKVEQSANGLKTLAAVQGHFA